MIGEDGISLVTAHGTAMTDVDRRLAAGETGVVDPPVLRVTNPLLRRQAIKSWTGGGYRTGGGYESVEDTTRRRST